MNTFRDESLPAVRTVLGLNKSGLKRVGIIWLSLGLFSCAQPPEPTPGQVVFGLAQKALSLDPRYATDATSTRINRLLYRRLVEFDESMRPTPGIATWRMLSPTRYRFQLLNEGRVFHDGHRLTSTDVAFSYRSVLSAESTSPHRYALNMVERIEVVDTEQIDFILNRPDPLFPGRATLGILSAGWNQETDPPMGSGPFQYLDNPDSDRLRIRRRSDGLVVEFIKVGDPSVRVLKLLAGELDLIQNDISPELVNYLQAQPGMTTSIYPGSNYAYLGFNLQDDVTANPKIRQAVALGLNRQEIVKYFFADRARLAESLLGENHWAGAKGLEPYHYDPILARRLLAEAGYNADNPLVLSYKISTDAERVRIATIIQKQLAQIGIQVNIRSYEWGSFYGDIKAGRFQMFSLVWVGVKMPDIFHYLFHSDAFPPTGANRGRLSEPVIDQLIERAESESDPNQQTILFQQLQTKLHQILPYVPLWREDHLVVNRSALLGYKTDSDGNYDSLNEVRWAD